MQFKCYGCDTDKDAEAFYPSSLKKQDYHCKSCSVLAGSSNRDKRTAKNDLKSKYSYAKSSAKSSGKPFSLTLEEYSAIVIQDCHYCHKLSSGLGVGLDRIDNDKSIGYTVDNVLPCCKECNNMRGKTFTVEEIEVAMKAILELRQKNMV